jgi:hypothetical protein
LPEVKHSDDLPECRDRARIVPFAASEKLLYVAEFGFYESSSVLHPYPQDSRSGAFWAHLCLLQLRFQETELVEQPIKGAALGNRSRTIANFLFEVRDLLFVRAASPAYFSISQRSCRSKFWSV